MKTEEEKKKHAEYMKIYRAKNKDKINKQTRDRLLNTKQNNPEKYIHSRSLSNIANRKYHEENNEGINKRAKERNWNYNKEKRVEIRRNFYMKDPTSAVLKQRKCYSNKKGLPFELDADWYNEQYTKGCAVTKIPFTKQGVITPWSAHIDKIIPELGYTKENCRLVCACFNKAKSNWTDKDVIKMAKELIRTSDT